MNRKVDYWLTLASPWTYLGHDAFMRLVRRHSLDVRWRPVPLRDVFMQTGGVALPQRHPARQNYRLTDLQRWRSKRGVALNLHPLFWPFEVALSDRCIIAIVRSGADPDAFVRAVTEGVWARDENCADAGHLARLLDACGHDEQAILQAAQSDVIGELYMRSIDEAVAQDVFGAPSYVLDGEVFWGQDRIDLLEDALTQDRPAFRPI